jgi:uncharacterized membrane protein YhaH (DUF805 family)
MDWKWFLLSFEGRINRKLIWMYFLALFAIVFVSELLTGNVTTNEASGLTMIISVLSIWPSLAVQAKRWHDTDRSAWWILIGLIPIIGGLWALVVTGFFGGTPGDNRFGPDPLTEAI